jgi:acyl carrier protein
METHSILMCSFVRAVPAPERLTSGRRAPNLPLEFSREATEGRDDMHVERDQQLSDTERELAELWCEVIDSAPVPEATTDFFEAGGDSAAMLTLEFMINERFSVELPAGAVLQAPTLGALARLVEITRSA